MEDKNNSISFIIPIFNEQEILSENLIRMYSLFESIDLNYEIILINDGSTDNTQNILNEFKKSLPKNKVSFFAHKKNLGIGATYKTGINNAKMEYSMLLAIDVILTKEILNSYLQNIGKADVLVGVRKKREGYNFLMKFNSWLYIKLVNIIFKLYLKDVNWFCIYPTNLLKKINIEFKGIVMLVEILVKCRDLKASFLEILTYQTERTTDRKSSAGTYSIMLKTLLDFIKFSILYKKSNA